MHCVRRRNMFRRMTNRFGVDLHTESVRWAAAEGVSEDVIAAVLLLHEHSVDEIVPKLSALELEQVIKLVGRSPRIYPPGTLDTLKQRRTPPSPQPPSGSARSNVGTEDAARTRGIGLPRAQETPPHSEHGAGADALHGAKGTGSSRSAEGNTGTKALKTGTPNGTTAETARRRLIVDDCMKGGLSVRMIADVTDIPRSSVHRAMRAIARAEAKKEVAIAEITAELLGKKLSHRRRGRA
jgi:hypothetical protein